MKVIIPLAGKGTRLRPHTHTVPKPMLRVAGKPVMDYVLDDVRRLGGVDEVVYITGHLKEAVEAHGATIGDLLADLTRKHAGLKAHLYNDQGKLRSFVNIYLNDEDIRYLQKEQTPVSAGDTISIIPSVAGGSRG